MTEISTDKNLISILEKLDHPMTRGELLNKFEEELFQFLIDNYLLVEESLFPLYSGKLLVTENLFYVLDKVNSRKEEAKLSYGLIGLEFDLVDTSEINRAIGAKLIKESLGIQLSHLAKLNIDGAANVYDYELSRVYSTKPNYFYDLGKMQLQKLNEGEHQLASSFETVVNFLHKFGVSPLFYGADHSITYYTIQSLSKLYENLTIVHFDAHCDLYISPYDSDDKLNHANVFRKILDNFENVNVFQVGVREFLYASGFVEEVPVERLNTYSSKTVSEITKEELFSALPNGIPVYISFDVDVLDPSICSNTGSPVPGGLSYYKALELIDYLSLKHNVIGADFVEVADCSANKMGTQVTANLISRMLLNSNSFVASNFSHSYQVSR